VTSLQPFGVFGRGRRQKWFYRAGRLTTLSDAPTQSDAMTFAWEVAHEHCDAPLTHVSIETRTGARVAIWEDDDGIWIEDTGRRQCLDATPSPRAPTFPGRAHARWLRQLWHEVVVCLVGGQPLPHPIVYRRPWHRDAAMVAMVLEITGHLPEIEPWIDGLRDPFDRNNSGHEEPDNLGQALFLVSRVRDRRHPLVDAVLARLPDHRSRRHLTGLTDYGPHPLYQTQWLKFGLRALGLDDSDWKLPEGITDSYAALCWWDRAGLTAPQEAFKAEARARYPYLGWAEDHFRHRAPPWHLLGPESPLTWEAHASEADYAAQDPLDPALAAHRICRPHSWHAAEAFLHLYHHASEPPAGSAMGGEADSPGR
jgi:hypothetical protein